MQIKVLSKDKEKLSFILKDIDYVIANTIRRLIIDEVPTLAIEEVNFIKNDSALYDEMIAHRLGLIPLKTDLKSYTLPEECKCKGKGCVHCQLHFSLKAKGPCTVYAADMVSKDPKVKPIYPKMPIVTLLENQELKLGAVAVLGKGKDHMKFSPGLVYYRAYPIFNTSGCKGSKKCVDVCPVKILSVPGTKVKVADPVKCILCKACEETCPNNAIKVQGSEKDFIFYIESWGQLTTKEMLLRAMEVFNKKLNEFNKLLSKV